ncbi:MAG: hypothetical protein M1833_005411 [Piccolia ochrophora]|nr:MAG: hypothetical protein M1833_005411 [Piccolia ochrophora]
MSSPLEPPIPLRDHCSVVHNNTLYAFSSDGFQSLPLSEGGEWEELPTGVPVAGASCVLASPRDDASKATMFVIGGTTKSSTEDYSGVQKYSFADKSWETIKPNDANEVTRNRTHQGAVYLSASSSILIYAGDQQGADVMSSSTFMLSTEPPYSLMSYGAQAPPGYDPLLLQWNESHALMVGGSEENKQVSLFSKESSWTTLDVSLGSKLVKGNAAALAYGDDGSKVLEIFDLSASPNTVEQVVLQKANGEPMTSDGSRSVPSQRRSSDPPPAKRRRRDLNLADWPEYNATLAPKATRSQFSLAQGDDGVVVMSGGSDDDPLCIFNARDNTWVNATSLIKGAQVQKSSPSATSDPTRSTTASSSPTSATAAPGSSDNGRSKALTVLGATLGAIFGVAILLILILLCLRWRKRKRQYREAAHHRRSSGAPDDEKDRLSFADRGTSSMGNGAGFEWPPKPPLYRSSSSSSAIISGRSGNAQNGAFFPDDGTGNGYVLSKVKGKNPNGEPALFEQKPTDRGVAFAVPAGSGQAKARPDSGKERSSGWSRYFSGNSATNLVHMNSQRSHASHDSQGNASDTRILSQVSQDSARVLPLQLGNSSSGGASSNAQGRVFPLSDGTRPEAGRHESSSTESTVSRNDAFSSGIPASVHDDTWTPIGRSDWNNGRAPSSVYTDSLRGSTVPRDISAASFPAVPRDSSATTFPRGGPGVSVNMVDSFDPHLGSHNHSDMSWLNLGNTRE